MSRACPYVDCGTTEMEHIKYQGIFEKHADLKYKYGQRQFWCRGYYVDTAGKNPKALKEYIANQLKEDRLAEQLSFKEYIDPFTGKKNK